MEINRNEYYKQVSEIISKDNSNKYCFDCKTPFPKYVSINNGIFLCKPCSDFHRTLGVNISFVRSINDVWDEYLLLYIQRGGNRRLKRVFEKLKIENKQEDKSYRYKTKACEFYRYKVNL